MSTAISRRSLLLRSGVALASGGAMLGSWYLWPRKSDFSGGPHIFFIDHPANEVRIANTLGTPPPEEEILAVGDVPTGYTRKFVFQLDERVDIFFPGKDQDCDDFKGNGCGYSDVVSIDALDLGPGLFRCKYLARGETHEAMFSIIDVPSRRAGRICLVHPTTTYQAYSDAGGRSLYHEKRSQPLRVSMLRPMGQPTWYHNPLHFYADRYLHEQGLEFFSIDNIALHRDKDVLNATPLVVLGVHDEYWSREMREALTLHLRRSGNLLSLSGNTMWWKMRVDGHEIEVDKLPRRMRAKNFGSQTGKWFWTDPEEKILGLSFRFAGYPLQRKLKRYDHVLEAGWGDAISEEEYTTSRGIEVIDPSHRVYQGTGLRRGEVFGAGSKVLRLEMDGLPLTPSLDVDRVLAVDAPIGLVPLGRAWAVRGTNLHKPAVMVDFRFESAGRVLNFGSAGWLRAAQGSRDETVSRITRNALELLLA